MEATEQASESKKLPHERNPTGKGGFGDNPQNRNPGGWNKEYSISYQYNRFLHMGADEFMAFAAKVKKNPKEIKMAELLAYQRVVEARKSLPDMKEITDRTEGKAMQPTDITTNGKELPTPILGGVSKEADAEN